MVCNVPVSYTASGDNCRNQFGAWLDSNLIVTDNDNIKHVLADQENDERSELETVEGLLLAELENEMLYADCQR